MVSVIGYIGYKPVKCRLSTENGDKIASFEYKPQFLVHNGTEQVAAEAPGVSSTASLLLRSGQVKIQAGPLLVLLTAHTNNAHITTMSLFYFPKYSVSIFPVPPFWVCQGIFTSLDPEFT